MRKPAQKLKLAVPEGLKPAFLLAMIGAAEAAPLSKPIDAIKSPVTIPDMMVTER
jgi:hypothetical protein